MRRLSSRLLAWFGVSSTARRRTRAVYYPCPHCGEAVRENAISCRHCGSDADTGWSEDGLSHGLSYSDQLDDDEYREFIADEFPADYTTSSPAWNRQLVWKITAVILLVIFAWSAIALF